MARWLYSVGGDHFSMDDSSETARTNTNNNSSPSNGSQQLARTLEERKKGLKLDFSSPESTKKSLTTPDIINLNVEAFIKSLTAARTPEGKLTWRMLFTHPTTIL